MQASINRCVVVQMVISGKTLILKNLKKREGNDSSRGMLSVVDKKALDACSETGTSVILRPHRHYAKDMMQYCS